jgi:hypothetical protein
MRESWQVAELLEDIANNADPTSVVRQMIKDIIKNTRVSRLTFGVLTNPAEEKVEIVYQVPIETAMSGVDGNPEEVLEWLQTGLGPDREVTILGNPPYFAIKQIYYDAILRDDLQDLMLKGLEHAGRRQMAEAQERRKRRQQDAK